MAGAAGTSLNLTFNASSTVEFVAEPYMTDGSAFPFDAYTLSFAIVADEWGRGNGLSFDQNDTQDRLYVAADTGKFAVSIPARALRPGSYTYEVNATEAITGKVVAILDGTITIIEDC